MKFAKKFVPMALVVTFALSMAACGGNKDAVVQQPENAPTESAPVESPTAETPATETGEEKDFTEMTQAELLALYPDVTPSGTVTVGSSTQMNADFMWGWTNTTTNANPKRMMFYGYRLIDQDITERWFTNNVVVKEVNTAMNDDGTKTFTFEINDNLIYNDGSPITAKDYCFSYMLMSSPEFAKLDAAAINGLNFVGYNSFNKGYLVNEDDLAVDAAGNVIETVTKDAEGKKVSEFSADKIPCKTFTGIRLLDTYKFSITAKAEELPYFYDLAFFVESYPLPMQVLAPTSTLTDDGEGVTLSAEFTEDMLRETMMNPDIGYRYKPMVTPGAYQFESFDNTTFSSVITTNPNFLCLSDGVKPRIQKIIGKLTTQSTQMNELEVGQVDLITGFTIGTDIDAGLALVDAETFDYAAYPRNGYGKVSFHCDFGPTQFEAVRQAMCYLLDRDEFGRQYSGGYAIVVDSRYSEAQWMYQNRKEELEEKLIKYTLNTDKAEELLIADGWTLNDKGAEFVKGTDKVRYKEVDGALMPLVIQWCSSKDNAVTDLLAIMLPPAAEKVGMKIEQTVQDSVLDSYYRRNVDEPFFHMFDMGTNFGNPDRPWESYSTDLDFS